MEIKNEGIVTPFETREGGEEKTLEKIALAVHGCQPFSAATVTAADVRYLLERIAVREAENKSLRQIIATITVASAAQMKESEGK